MIEITCESCKETVDADDIVWADVHGNLTMSGMPYCQACLPNQPDYDTTNTSKD